MSKQQPAIPRYVALPGEAETSDQYYERRAKERGEANLAKGAGLPSLHEVFSALSPATHTPDTADTAPEWVSQLLPSHDPLRAEARRKRFNGE